MANPNFASLLDEQPDEVNRPKPLPAGTYHCRVQGQPRYDKSSKKGTDFVEFTLKPVSALDDVDQEELNNMGGFADKTIRATFYVTENSVYRLDEFHEHCGIDLAVEASRRSRNDECMNAEVLATLRHEASDDGQSVFARLAKTAPVT